MTVGVNTAELPVGDLLFDRLDLDDELGDETVTVDIAEDLGDEELRVAVVEEGGSYFVSSFYTAAELAAASAGYTMPATSIPAVGAATPEDALRGVIDAGIQLDVAGLIELTPAGRDGRPARLRPDPRRARRTRRWAKQTSRARWMVGRSRSTPWTSSRSR